MSTFDAAIFKHGREDRPYRHFNCSWNELLDELKVYGHPDNTSIVNRVEIARQGHGALDPVKQLLRAINCIGTQDIYTDDEEFAHRVTAMHDLAILAGQAAQGRDMVLPPLSKTIKVELLVPFLDAHGANDYGIAAVLAYLQDAGINTTPEEGAAALVHRDKLDEALQVLVPERLRIELRAAVNAGDTKFFIIGASTLPLED